MRLRTVPIARSLHSSARAQAVARVTPAAATAKANIQTSTQSKTLASAVLLNTQRNWKSETVVTLKAELKRKGLSQQGNKSTLVTRLQNAEASESLLPKAPAAQPAAPRRSVSTTAPAAAAPSAAAAAAPSTPRYSTNNADGEDVVSTAGDQQIETPRLAKAAPVTSATLSSAPGIPIKPKTTASFFDIKFPNTWTPPPQFDQIIPTIPSNFTVTKKARPVVDRPAPRVVTMASAATHAGGGPTSPSQSVSDSYALEWDDTSALKSDATLAQVESAVSAAADAVSNLVEINLPPVPSAKEALYVVNTEPLNEAERRGAWVLTGLIAGVFLGGYVESKAKSKGEHEHEDKDKKEGNKD